MFVMNGNKEQQISHKWGSKDLESIEEPIYCGNNTKNNDWIKIINPQIQEIQGSDIEEWKMLLVAQKRTNNKSTCEAHHKFELSLKDERLECEKIKNSDLCMERPVLKCLSNQILEESSSVLRIKIKDRRGIFSNARCTKSHEVKDNLDSGMGFTDDKKIRLPAIRSTYNDLKFIIKASKSTTPFRSPITKNVVNLKLSPSMSKSDGLLHKLTPFDPFQAVDNENTDKYDNGQEGEMKSYPVCDSGFRKQKRKSSIQAEQKIKRLLEEEKEKDLKDKWEMEEMQKENSMFCGIPKHKKVSNETRASDSFISAILRPKSQNSPLKTASILQDKTNSPMKSQFLSPQKIAPDNAASGMFNSRFFLQDLEFEEEKIDHEDFHVFENGDAEKIKEERSNHRTYIKARDLNTKNNEGYTTVVLRKKSVIDLFSCPKTYYRKSSRKRRVYFDLDGWVSVHNDQTNVKPILVESPEAPSYEWNGEKMVVDIIKRVDLWTDYSAEELIYKKIDKVLN